VEVAHGLKKRKQPSDRGVVAAEFRRSKALRVLSIIAIAFVVAVVISMLLEPAPAYRVVGSIPEPLDSDKFAENLAILTDSRLTRASQIEVLPNGENFYRAELEAIRAARHSINLEAYIFHRGDIGKEFVEALAERARAGVKVHVVVDGMGSIATHKGYFHDLLAAGGQVHFYHALRWNNWLRYNNRTHRELMVIDGQTAFIGGAGIDDQWLKSTKKELRWRDTVVRVTGPVAASLQGTFTENWLESAGQILSGEEYLPPTDGPGPSALVVNSSPASGGSTRAHILFELLIAAAQKSIHITTPYFLPDGSARQELLRAIGRGVEVVILVPGRSDHFVTRSASRRLYGDLLHAGAKVYEYEPTMLHAKIMLVDGTWAVVGSTNFDNRSLGLNDEVNLALRDPSTAAGLEDQFQSDLAQSHAYSYQEWTRRSVFERSVEWVGFVFQRQQ
jgi:cardiolipin synthase